MRGLRLLRNRSRSLLGIIGSWWESGSNLERECDVEVLGSGKRKSVLDFGLGLLLDSWYWLLVFFYLVKDWLMFIARTLVITSGSVPTLCSQNGIGAFTWGGRSCLAEQNKSLRLLLPHFDLCLPADQEFSRTLFLFDTSRTRAPWTFAICNICFHRGSSGTPTMSRRDPFSEAAPDDARTSFMDLPVECRMRIYGYLLQEDETIWIQTRMRYSSRDGMKPAGAYWSIFKGYEIVRRDASRDFPKHRGLTRDPESGRISLNPPSRTAILYACQQVYREAEEVLYGSNHFTFYDIETFSDFAELIGSRVQHLRYLTIHLDEVNYLIEDAFEEKDVAAAMKHLQKATNLRMLRFSHYDVCNSNADRIGHACKEMLLFLRESRLAAGKDVTHLADVLRFELGDCTECLYYGDEEPHNHGFFPLPGQDDFPSCQCACGTAEHKNEIMEAAANEIVKKYLEADQVDGGHD